MVPFCPGKRGKYYLSGLLQTDSGLYSVDVANDTPVIATSTNAPLSVNMRRVPGVVFGTGVDDSGGLMPNGSTDLHYILAQSVDPAFQGPDAIVANDAGFSDRHGPGWPAAPTPNGLRRRPTSQSLETPQGTTPIKPSLT